ncbi:MAG TPA: ester cyclase [Thermoanaerobaculia bacterium]|nr:ester cyclase [Thermoanaerobaculia bacterium]
MSEAQNVALARRFIDDIWNHARSESVREFVHPQAVGHFEGFEVRGPEGVLPAWASMLGAFPDLKIIIQDVVAQGESVVVRWTASGTHKGPHLGFPPTMKLVGFRGITWLRFSEGRIIESWDSWNQGRLFNELQAARKG